MIVGIDLGTTNSLISVWKDGKPELIKNVHGEYLTPSVIGVSDNGGILVGNAAKEQLVTKPHDTTSVFKRYMGTNRSIKLSDKEFLPEELSAIVLKSLKQDAEHYLGTAIDKAIISVPAFFNDTQRKATKIAGQLAGLNVERLINEPTAAAIAYGLHNVNEEKRILVFDLGGGTFDVSILEIFDGVMEVHATAGDNNLGGEDFVNLLVDAFLSDNQLDAASIDINSMSALRKKMEHAKIELNNSSNTKLDIKIGDENHSWEISRDNFEQLSTPLLQRLQKPVNRALRDSKLMISDIDEIVLVGGATKSILIKKLVSRMFGRLPLRQINPEEVVALGVAVQAGLLERDKALDEIVFTDVTPYSLGIETSGANGNSQVGGLFQPIMERNTIIPASRVQTFFPTNDYQKFVNIRVFQGESRLVNENIFLGSFELSLPKKVIAESAVDVRFTYDNSGLLEVEAKVLATGKIMSIEIVQQEASLSSDEIAERLKLMATLKLHPRDDLENQAAINKAKHVYEELLGEDRVYVGEMLTKFYEAIESQDINIILRSRKQLLAELDKISI